MVSKICSKKNKKDEKIVSNDYYVKGRIYSTSPANEAIVMESYRKGTTMDSIYATKYNNLIDEVSMSGNCYSAGHASGQVVNGADHSPRSHWGRGRSVRGGDACLRCPDAAREEINDDDNLRDPLSDRSLSARRVQGIRVELGAHYPTVRRSSRRLFSSSRRHQRYCLGPYCVR